FSLIAQAVRIRNRAAVYGCDKPLRLDSTAGQVNAYLSYHSRVAVVALIGHARHPAATDNTVIGNARLGRGTAFPFGSFGCCFQAIDDPLLAKMFDPESNRIGLHPRTQLVHEALVGKGVLDPQR